MVVGAGYVPGINAVIRGAVTSANLLGWQVLGIKDGFNGLLNPDRYPSGGLIPLDMDVIENLDPASGSILGQSARLDPFNVRTINELGMVEEVDMSDQILRSIKEKQIDAVIAVVGDIGITIFYKLHLKGLNTICIPRSVENDVAVTAVSFGFNTALTATIEMLDRAKQASKSAKKIAVVEVLGRNSGWIALQSGIAASADVILIPEIPADLDRVADRLKEKISSGRDFGLVVVAEGARFPRKSKSEVKPSPLKASLSPLATGENSEYVIQKSGMAAEKVAQELQLLLTAETYPLLSSPWVRGEKPSSVDRQLGLAYGAAAVRSVKNNENGVMVAFLPPLIKSIPLEDAINKVRVVPLESEFIKIADSLGIYVGKEKGN